MNEQHAVVEPKPDGDPSDITSQLLRQRIRQQELLAELGVMSLQNPPLQDLLRRAVRLTAEGLQADFAKIMEFSPGENALVVSAGVGWGPDVIGKARVGADLASPAGFALRTGKPVISNHLENEDRFRTPELLVRHGVRRAMNVILQGDRAPYGVLEVDSRSEGEFVAHDLAFLQGAANILGMAIERQRHEQRLKSALECQRMLLKEINHRVKNSLAIVSSLLVMQARNSENHEVYSSLEDAVCRVNTIARAHERLYQTSDFEQLDIGAYLKDVCADLPCGPEHDLQIEVQTAARIATDRAISLSLIVVELVTNAVKHAYPGGEGGPVRVSVTWTAGRLIVSVRDEGVGLPPGFDMHGAKGLGMRLVQGLAGQLDAKIEVRQHCKGVEFVVQVDEPGDA
ncbi:MAG TPA: histidine kinase dimerization/phosphoacceptor domain -containing protein [Hyphomicrobiaceae bacterium]|jgi:two-component sensor histidine kinase|nr:histidine kinase dimerization/phosphoacceptor domain -containing protein [Hyphomicrobiaceae bacterium]